MRPLAKFSLALLGFIFVTLNLTSNSFFDDNSTTAVNIVVDIKRIFLSPSMVKENWKGHIEIPSLTKYLTPNEVDIFRKIMNIQKLCGEVCNTSMDGYENLDKKV